MTSGSPSGPLRVESSQAGPVGGLALAVVRPVLERLLALPTLNAIHEQVQRMDPDRPFVDRALDALDVRYDLAGADLEHVPREGRLVVVSNHPFGSLEGLILLSLLGRVRPDVKLLGNAALRVVPELREQLLFTQVFGSRKAATARNLRPLRAAVRWLEQGHALAVFPAGRVSHLHLRQRQVTDAPWHPAMARLIRRTGAPVVPAFFEGANSLRFQLLGLVHRRLRTLLLPREMLRKRGSRVSVRLGDVIPHRRLASIKSDQAMIDYLRMRTYILKGRTATARRPRAPAVTGVRRASLEPVMDPVPPQAIVHELTDLPREHRLLRQGELEALYAYTPQIPRTLLEIGRLRELTFRAAGQGSGRACDLHEVDEHYLHLLIWSPRRREVVGSYRIGPTDDIVPRLGKRGLFTSTIFKYDDRLLEQISPALELGRAFVRPEYQRDYSPLLVLWKGVGRYVAHHPRYRRLFGSVSISDEYNAVSKQLLMAFLELNHGLPTLRRLIHPRRPPRFTAAEDVSPSLRNAVINDMHEVDALISQIEADGRGMPVLLRQYLKLGARLLGFSVTPQFGNSLNALVLVDLLEADPAVLARYVGKDRTAAFLAYHRHHAPPATRARAA